LERLRLRKLEEMEAGEDEYSVRADMCSLYFECLALRILWSECMIRIRKRVKTSRPLSVAHRSTASTAGGAQEQITYLCVLVMAMCSPLRRRIFWRCHHLFAGPPSAGFVAWAPVYSVSRGPCFIEKQAKSWFPPTRCRQPPTSRRYAQSYPVAI